MTEVKDRKIFFLKLLLLLIFPVLLPGASNAWHDETHLAIAKVAGYRKWFNAAGADMAKIKAGDIEFYNHFVNNPPGTVVTPKMVLAQVKRYNRIDTTGHLYGAIIKSIRDYMREKEKGKYGEYHLSFCAHYLGDLSQPLHNVAYNDFNRKHHVTVDGIINHEVLDNLDKIQVHPLKLESEKDLEREIARIANISIKLGNIMEIEGRLPTKKEACVQMGLSASLFRAVLKYPGKMNRRSAPLP